MSHEIPHGMAVGKPGITAARLTLQLRILCRNHEVNSINDLPPDALGEAVAITAEIDRLKHEDLAHREVLREHGRRGLAKSHGQATARREARLEAYRQRLEAEGGLYGAPARRIAKAMGLGKTTGENYMKVLRERDAAKQRTCPTCRQPLPDCSVIPRDEAPPSS
jgi:hypothetical protein